jgi:hypothetical protein
MKKRDVMHFEKVEVATGDLHGERELLEIWLYDSDGVEAVLRQGMPGSMKTTNYR